MVRIREMGIERETERENDRSDLLDSNFDVVH